MGNRPRHGLRNRSRYYLWYELGYSRLGNGSRYWLWDWTWDRFRNRTRFWYWCPAGADASKSSTDRYGASWCQLTV